MVEERRAQAAGLRFRLRSTTHPTAETTYLLVHGIGMSHRYLRRLHAVLAERASVHSIDLPGFGGLPTPRTRVTVAAMAAATAEILDGIGTQAVVGVGHSMGAQWVVELGVQRPDLVSHVVALGPVADDRRRTVATHALALGLDSLREPPGANAIVFSDYLRAGPRWYLRQLREMLTYPIEDRVGMLRVPLLVLRGGVDPVASRDWCRRLRDAAPGARIVEVPERSHIVQHTAPRAVAAALRSFAESR